jgi:hypothetical protein
VLRRRRTRRTTTRERRMMRSRRRRRTRTRTRRRRTRRRRKSGPMQEDGSFACTWRSGLDSVAPGYRTYVSNNQERFWRTLKGLLPRNFANMDVSNLITRLCRLLNGWTGHKDYQNLFADSVPWQARFPSGATGRTGALQQLNRSPTAAIQVLGLCIHLSDTPFG